MRVIRFLNQARVLRAIHGGLVIFWILLWIVAAFTGWVKSVMFVSHLSLAALVLASAAAWQATRTEVKEDDKNDV